VRVNFRRLIEPRSTRRV